MVEIKDYHYEMIQGLQITWDFACASRFKLNSEIRMEKIGTDINFIFRKRFMYFKSKLL